MAGGLGGMGMRFLGRLAQPSIDSMESKVAETVGKGTVNAIKSTCRQALNQFGESYKQVSDLMERSQVGKPEHIGFEHGIFNPYFKTPCDSAIKGKMEEFRKNPSSYPNVLNNVYPSVGSIRQFSPWTTGGGGLKPQ